MGPKRKATLRAKREAQQREYDAEIAALRATGASCGSCKHITPYPYRAGGFHCSLQSDWEGYTIVTTAGLCLQFNKKDQA